MKLPYILLKPILTEHSLKAAQTQAYTFAVALDATKGQIYSGELEVKRTKIKLPNGIKSIRDLKTHTKVYVNLGEPELASQIAQKYVDGVGLLRAEFIISEYIGVHPRYLLEKGRRKYFVDKWAEGLAEFCQAFGERQII